MLTAGREAPHEVLPAGGRWGHVHRPGTTTVRRLLCGDGCCCGLATARPPDASSPDAASPETAQAGHGAPLATYDVDMPPQRTSVSAQMVGGCVAGLDMSGLRMTLCRPSALLASRITKSSFPTSTVDMPSRDQWSMFDGLELFSAV